MGGVCTFSGKALGSKCRSSRLPVELTTVRVAATHWVQERVLFGYDEVALVLLQLLLLFASQLRLFVEGRSPTDDRNSLTGSE